jgi:hypothetical protein
MKTQQKDRDGVSVRVGDSVVYVTPNRNGGGDLRRAEIAQVLPKSVRLNNGVLIKNTRTKLLITHRG